MTDRTTEPKPAPEREIPRPDRDAPMATSPKNPVTGRVEPSSGPMDRPGTENAEKARKAE